MARSLGIPHLLAAPLGLDPLPRITPMALGTHGWVQGKQPSFFCQGLFALGLNTKYHAGAKPSAGEMCTR